MTTDRHSGADGHYLDHRPPPMWVHRRPTGTRTPQKPPLDGYRALHPQATLRVMPCALRALPPSRGEIGWDIIYQLRDSKRLHAKQARLDGCNHIESLRTDATWPPTCAFGAAPPPTPLRPLATRGGSRFSLRLVPLNNYATKRPSHCAPSSAGRPRARLAACGCAAGACRSPLRTRR